MCLKIQTELCSVQKTNSNLNISEIFSIIYIERLRKEEKINRVNAVLKDLKSDSSQPFMREVPLRILVRLKSRFVGGSAASLNIAPTGVCKKWKGKRLIQPISPNKCT